MTIIDFRGNIYLVLWMLVLFGNQVLSNVIFYEEGQEASLQCIEDEGEVLYWFLHGKGIAVGSAPGNDTVSMGPKGTLDFKNVSKAEHEGNHVCIVRIEERMKAYSTPMKVRPISGTNLWQKQYKRMFLQGLIAALICFFLFAGFCFIQKNKWRQPLEKIADPKLVGKPYENQALEIEEAEAYNSKM